MPVHCCCTCGFVRVRQLTTASKPELRIISSSLTVQAVQSHALHPQQPQRQHMLGGLTAGQLPASKLQADRLLACQPLLLAQAKIGWLGPCLHPGGAAAHQREYSPLVGKFRGFTVTDLDTCEGTQYTGTVPGEWEDVALHCAVCCSHANTGSCHTAVLGYPRGGNARHLPSGTCNAVGRLNVVRYRISRRI